MNVAILQENFILKLYQKWAPEDERKQFVVIFYFYQAWVCIGNQHNQVYSADIKSDTGKACIWIWHKQKHDYETVWTM